MASACPLCWNTLLSLVLLHFADIMEFFVCLFVLKIEVFLATLRCEVITGFSSKVFFN